MLEKERGRILDHVTRNTSMYERGLGGEKYTMYLFSETASQQNRYNSDLVSHMTNSGDPGLRVGSN